MSGEGAAWPHPSGSKTGAKGPKGCEGARSQWKKEAFEEEQEAHPLQSRRTQGLAWRQLGRGTPDARLHADATVRKE